MKYLNLGCGLNWISEATNVDIKLPADEIYDLNKADWKWETNSIDGIYMFHSLEHFPDVFGVLKECHRILKRGGFLNIHAPHSTSANANGCLLHYRTFSYNSLKDYLEIHNKMFKTTQQRLVWLPHYEWLPIQWLIDLNPIFCERIWAYWIGGCVETVWIGTKI